MATHSSILAWEIPWTEEPGGLQSQSDTTQRLNNNSCKRPRVCIINSRHIYWAFTKYWVLGHKIHVDYLILSSSQPWERVHRRQMGLGKVK